MIEFKEELNWTPRRCRERLHELLRKMRRTFQEQREVEAIKDYLRSMRKD